MGTLPGTGYLIKTGDQCSILSPLIFYIMANEELHPAKKIYPAHGDAIRIVPLHVPDTVPTPTAEATAT